jgi:hypothetical protein
MHFNYFSFLHV